MKWVFKNKLCFGNWARGCLVLLFSCFCCVTSMSVTWVGGSTGSWSVSTNWSSGAVPNFTDDVNIPASTVITIDCHAVCRHFSGSGGTLNGASNFTLRVFGDFDYGSVNMAFTGDIHLEAINTAADITSAGVVLNNDVYFNGPGGVWNITDGLFVNGTVFLVTGTINVNSVTLEAERFYSNYSSSRALDYSSNGNISIIGPYAYPYHSWQVSSPGSGLTITSDNTSSLVFYGFSSSNSHTTFSSDNQTYEGSVEFDNSIGRVTMYGDNTFDDVLNLETDVYMVNSNTVEDLLMTSGHIYTIQQAETLTIINTGSWVLSGSSCDSWTTFRGTHPGNATLAAIDYQPGTTPLPNIDYIIIEDIESVTDFSPSPATALNLDALANWPNNPPGGGTLIWDGSGDGISWNDPANWSGSLCAPGPLDDVVFNSGSFSPGQTNCTIDVSNAVCRNMTWSGVTNNPIFSGSSAKNLTFYGSLTLEPTANMTWSHSGYTRFKAHSGTQTVDIQDQLFLGDTYFEGNGGIWDLAFDFQSSANVYVLSGDFGTDDGFGPYDMSIKAFYADIYNPRVVDIQNSTITCTSAWDIYDQNNVPGSAADGSITFNSSGSTIVITSGHFQSNGDFGDTYENLELNNTNGTQHLYGANTFDGYVYFLGNGYIPSANTIGASGGGGDLKFSPGKAYDLGAAQTLHANSDLDAIGSCSAGYIYIKNASFSKASGPAQLVEYCILKNNTASSVGFTADNSIGIGTCTGWTINNPYSGPLYFRAASTSANDWNTGTNWYLDAGYANLSNPPCPPNPLNDVYFSNNSSTVGSFNLMSGQAVVDVDVSNAFCKGMYWGGNVTPNWGQYTSVSGSTPAIQDIPGDPKIEDIVPNSVLHVFGEMMLQDGLSMNWDFGGRVVFEADAAGAYRIKSANEIFQNEVTFDGYGTSASVSNHSEWQLHDAFETFAGGVGVTIEKGTLTSNGKKITAGHIYSTGSQFRGLDIASSSIELRTAGNTVIGNSYAWYTSGSNLYFNASSSDISIDNTSVGGLARLYAAGPVTFNNITFELNSNAEIYGSGTVSGNAARTFNNATFLGNSNLYCDNLYAGNLTFSPGYLNTLTTNTEQFILNTGNLVASGTVSQTVFIKPSIYGSGNEARIKKDGGIICIDYASIRDNDAISVNGAQFFDGPNGFNVDNNTGWAFTGCTPSTITGCVGDAVPFTTQFSGSAYSWGFGDGGTASTAAPSHTYTVSGVYTVTVTVTTGTTQNVEYFTANITQSCCQEASDPNYTNISGTISADVVWPSKVYVSADVFVTSGAVLEVANSDVVFAEDAGIFVESTSRIESVNSTYRPCNPDDEWDGIDFTDDATGKFHENVIIGAAIGLGIVTDGMVEVSNNEFVNCQKGIYLDVTGNDPMNHMITGNTFTLNEDRNYTTSGADAFFGIQIVNLGLDGIISQNDFSYASTAQTNDLYYGIHNNAGEIVASENNFTNVLYPYFQMGSAGLSSFENNEIDYNQSAIGLYVNGSPLELFGVQITGSSSTTYVGNNTITLTYQSGQASTGIYSAVDGTVSHNNRITGMLYGIYYDQCDGEISRNEVMDAEIGIFLEGASGDVIDNTVTASATTGISLLDCYSGIFVRRNTVKNDPLSSGTVGIEYIVTQNTAVSTVDFTDNCIYDTDNAMYFDNQAGANPCNTLPDVIGNYLFTYTSHGIYVNDFAATIGTPGNPSRNSFVPNVPTGGGAPWDIREVTSCGVNVYGYWPMTINTTNVIDNGTGANDNSYATCGNQTVKEGDLPVFQAYINNRYPVDYEDHEYLLKADFIDEIARTGQMQRGDYAMTTYGILASNDDLQQAGMLITGLEGRDLLTGDELRWIKYRYAVKTGDFEQASQYLDAITPADVDEEELLFTEKVRMKLARSHSDLRSLSAQDSTSLQAIDDRRGEYAPMARDMMHVARGRHPYIFDRRLPVRNPLAGGSTGSEPGENALLIYPNPTPGDFIVSFNVENLDNARLIVSTMLGVQMMNVCVANGNARQLQLDASGLPAGLYMVSFYNNDELMDAVQLVKN